MNIQYAILGFLSWKPLAGYDLKKLFAESAFLYWSGNNNQIYRALVSLFEQGLVEYMLEEQDGIPDRKVYSLTPAGEAALDDWLRQPPAGPELRKPFLVQLAWVDRLPPSELETLLESYQAELGLLAQMQTERLRRKRGAPERTWRERLIWDEIQKNLLESYRQEIEWVERLRGKLNELTPG